MDTQGRTCLIIISKLFFYSPAHPLVQRCVCVCVVSVIVKRPVLPLCVVDGRSRNPLYYYYYYVKSGTFHHSLVELDVAETTCAFDGLSCSLVIHIYICMYMCVHVKQTAPENIQSVRTVWRFSFHYYRHISQKIFSLLQQCGVSLSTITDILVRRYSVCYNSVAFLFPLLRCWQERSLG